MTCISSPLKALGNSSFISPLTDTCFALKVPTIQSFIFSLAVAKTPPSTIQSSSMTSSANMLPATKVLHNLTVFPLMSAMNIRRQSRAYDTNESEVATVLRRIMFPFALLLIWNSSLVNTAPRISTSPFCISSLRAYTAPSTIVSFCISTSLSNSADVRGRIEPFTRFSLNITPFSRLITFNSFITLLLFYRTQVTASHDKKSPASFLIIPATRLSCSEEPNL